MSYVGVPRAVTPVGVPPGRDPQWVYHRAATPSGCTTGQRPPVGVPWGRDPQWVYHRAMTPVGVPPGRDPQWVYHEAMWLMKKGVRAPDQPEHRRLEETSP
ncbi:hypothetical protein INR49_006420 [Caranx melampygus]|nr:hypothetical protein INR49_006420 [Caranx melampygus]